MLSKYTVAPLDSDITLLTLFLNPNNHTLSINTCRFPKALLDGE